MQADFEGPSLNIGELARGIAQRRDGISKGALFARLSRLIHAMERHGAYFRNTRYETTISRHCDAHTAFDILLQSIREDPGASRLPNQGLRPVLEQLLARSSVPEFLETQLQLCMDSPDTPLPLYLPVDTLRWILTQTYAGLCKLVGPVDADRIFAAALAKAREACPDFEAASLL
jgi:hypothetical protein